MISNQAPFFAKYRSRLLKSLTALSVGVIAVGCGISSKGLDAEIKGKTAQEFYQSCYENLSSVKDSNPKEFESLKGTSLVFYDLTQPKDVTTSLIQAPYVCQSLSETIEAAALKDNVNLKTLREMYAWRTKNEIDRDTSTFKEWKLAAEGRKNEPYMVKSDLDGLTSTLKRIKENQNNYLVLTGKPYGSIDLALPNLTPSIKLDEAQPTQNVVEQPATAIVAVQPTNPVLTPKPSSEIKQASPQQTWTPSFDCAKASTMAEKAICTDPLLGKLDGALAENYKFMLASNIDDWAKSDLKAKQRIWLAERNKCTENQCLVSSYRKRMDEICEYPVLSGAHPICTSSDAIK